MTDCPDDAVTDLSTLQKRFAELGLKPRQFSECLTEQGVTPPWRVTRVDRGWCSLIGLDERGVCVTQRVHTDEWSVAVGDWVTLSGGETPSLERILDCETHLRRATSGGDVQLIAANVDTVFVVAAFGPTEKLERRGIGARRIERYLSAVSEGGATPVVILNKLDVSDRGVDETQILCADLASRFGVETVAVSAIDSTGLTALRPHLGAGNTVAFVGPSGVGKSTLINALMGQEEAATSAVRSADMKGRHTTTRRELTRMPEGAFLVDTPGMRAFAVFLENDVVPGFDDVEEMSKRCRFGDCHHESEPGCSVLEAVDRGELPWDRLNNYRAILRDAKRAERKTAPKVRHDQRKADKRFARLVKQAKTIKKR